MFVFLPDSPHPPAPSPLRGEGESPSSFPLPHFVERRSGGGVLEKVSSPQPYRREGWGVRLL